MKTDPGAGLPECIAVEASVGIAFVGSEPGGVLRTGDAAATLGLTTFDGASETNLPRGLSRW